MAITINGTGTITGISQGGLPDDVITAADIKDSDYQAPLTAGTDYLAPNGDGSNLTNLPAGGSPDVQLSYNGNTQTVLASSGVSSVTYNGSGSNTVNFSTSFSNTNYYLADSFSNGSSPHDFQGLDSVSRNTGNITVYTCYVSGTGSQAGSHNVLNFYINIWSA